MRKEYVEVLTYEKEGYAPVIDFSEWRVAILNYCEELEMQNIDSMQKHNETDEVFVLLKGNCTLFIGGEKIESSKIEAIKMEPYKLYNIKMGIYHTHTLDKEGSVLIIENRNTGENNSITHKFTIKQKAIFNRINIV